MTANDHSTTANPPNAESTLTALVNGQLISLTDPTPTGSQILAAAGLRPAADYALLHWPSLGPTNEIGIAEVLKLSNAGSPWEFIATQADGVLYFVLDGERFAWAGRLDEEIIRRIGRVTANKEIWVERTDVPDRLLEVGEVVKLERKGVEQLYTRERVWKLEVQGELTEWDQPQVVVRDALVKAGFDPNKPWIIILKVKDEPKQEVELTDTIDLSRPGIERLRLRPKNVTNGDGQEEARRDFGLLAKDVKFLEASGFRWQTINDVQRWLIVENYPLPPGYNVAICRMAIDIPADYPSANLDMFYCDPPLLANAAIPPTTEHRQSINGVQFQRWSRHRPSGSWSPEMDNLSTHFGLIEESIGREVGA